MAIWQFDFYVVPKKNYIKGEDFSNEYILSWSQYDISLVEIDFLDKEKRWSNSIVQYGHIDETCIKFRYENKKLEEISCRLDLRSISKVILNKILDYIKNIDGMIIYEGNIYDPNVDDILNLIKSSKAYKFCKEPMKVFEELSNS